NVKPNRKSIRWQEHSYDSDSSYFITICTYDKRKILGSIIDQEMKLSDIGILAENEWIKSFEMREELSCPVYCIMPNHIHAIITITKPYSNDSDNNNKLLPKSLSSFIGGFKGAVTSALRKQNIFHPVWQNRFHDRVIRDHHEFRFIENYIIMNPIDWCHNEDI
ncbi:MAG: transposase, partial [Bacteroidales bacterium]